MKLQCDVCEKSPATVICCADEAALCGECDVQVHAANKLASKHQRLLLHCIPDNLPPCDICQHRLIYIVVDEEDREKASFIFCVEDRALLCRECDAPLHSANSLSANHQRYLATGIRVALSSTCDILSSNSHHITSTSTAQLPDPHKKEQLELEWLMDANLLCSTAAEVPELPTTSSINRKSRTESPDDDDNEEHFKVPDLG